MNFPTEPSNLGLNYQDGEGMREVAAHVRRDGQWLYHSRGTAKEARDAILNKRPGFIGGIAEFAPEDVRVTLDQPSWGTRDDKDLCWAGPSMSVPDFIDWYEERS
jgi:hypothetical protein